MGRGSKKTAYQALEYNLDPQDEGNCSQHKCVQVCVALEW